MESKKKSWANGLEKNVDKSKISKIIESRTKLNTEEDSLENYPILKALANLTQEDFWKINEEKSQEIIDKIEELKKNSKTLEELIIPIEFEVLGIKCNSYHTTICPESEIRFDMNPNRGSYNGGINIHTLFKVKALDEKYSPIEELFFNGFYQGITHNSTIIAQVPLYKTINIDIPDFLRIPENTKTYGHIKRDELNKKEEAKIIQILDSKGDIFGSFE